ncbi:MAG: prepilin-type N-terminal cleavage/methylation domain-containing protein [Candidatus Omnitrophica bacterium]|nr:prepilin-type N-terminal cleavage/methylation domain-containing protein [Candidatus Omnitrophota bacterium]
MSTPGTNKKNTGFTLVEVLVSTVIIAVVSVGSYAAFYVLSGESEAARNKLHAIALGQAALEEVRAASKIGFDTLASANFPDNIDQLKYGGFHRAVTITNDAATIELKRVDVAINWTERNAPRQYNLAVLLARPPEPLPGNIHGTVTNRKTGLPVDSAKIDINYVQQTTLTATAMTSPTTATAPSNGFYTFLDSARNPRLKPGDWNLAVSRKGFYNFKNVVVANLESGEDREVNAVLDPKPDPAYIKGTTVNAKNNNSPVSIYVYLYEGAKNVTEGWTKGAFVFGIDFEDTNPRSFTIASREITYKDGYCGSFPGGNCNGWGKDYDYRGWSSALVQADGGYVSGNPWLGNKGTDRLTVNPGDTLDLGDIPFVPVPTATLKGHIYDSARTGIPGTVYVRWHDGSTCTYGSGKYARPSDSSGYYETIVPAEQALFPDEIKKYYSYAIAKGSLNLTGSCGLPSATALYSNNDNWERIGPLEEGGVLEHDFYLLVPPETKYGNARGVVIDGKNLTPLSAVNVSIWGSKQTDSLGIYDFRCSPEQEAAGYFMIPVKQYEVQAAKNGYYTFLSEGNTCYSPKTNIQIMANQSVTYQTVKLWPVQTGTISGRVVEGGVGGGAIPGATVEITRPGAKKETATTGSDGRFIFSNVPETWPPAEIDPQDPYYNHSISNYSLKASHTEAYEPYGPTPYDIVVNSMNGYTYDCGDIALKKKGQF